MSLYARFLTSPLHYASRSHGIYSASRGLSCSVLPRPTIWRRPLVSPSRTFTASLTEQSRSSPSVVQFLSNNICRATHRSRTVNSSRGRNSYSPPPPNSQGLWRRFITWLDSIPHNVLFWGILVINGAVFVTWRAATALYQSSGSADLYAFMMQNFTVSMRNVSSGRVWTLLTACFSHEGVAHIFINAFTYYFMAPPVLQLLGNSGFLALYLGGGIVSSVISLWWNSRRGRDRYSSHGASGAVYAVISFFACVAPTVQFALFGVIPLPAWLFVSGVFLMDGYESLHDSRTTTDNAGHIGGILGGIGYFLCKRFRIF